LLVKLWELIKKIATKSGREATRSEKKKRAEERERQETGLDENAI
jgi:hypothetical protein